MDGLYEQIRIALHQIWQRRWLALAIAWGLCLAGWLAVALFPNSYESKARVYYQAQVLLPSAGAAPVDRQADLFRIRQALTSSANLEKVVRRTDLNGLVASERDLEAQVAALRPAIKIVAALDNPSLFELSATSSVSGFSNGQNARIAHGIVQTLLDLLAEGGVADDRAATGQTITLLDDELKRLEARLQEAEQRRVEFEQKFLGILPGEGSIASRMATARAEIANLDQQLIVAQSSLGSLRGQMAGIPSSVANPGGGGGGVALSQIATLEAQLSQSQARGWTDQHPDVVSTRQQIDRLRPQAAAERRGGGGGSAGSSPNPAFSSLRALAAEKEAQVAGAQSRKAQLQGSMADLGAKQDAEPGVVAEQARLNRDYDVLKRQYDALLQDREQVRLRGDVQTKTDSQQFRVIDSASLPTVPASPNRPLLLTGILFVALCAGAGAAFVLGQLQTTFPTQGRLERATGLPVLGSISEIVSPAERVSRSQRLKWFGGAGSALAGAYAILMLVEFWQRSAVA